MTTPSLPVFSYDSSVFNALMTEYKNLRTFADVASWDERAKAELEEAVKGVRIIDEKTFDASRQLEQLKKEREEKNIFARAFSSRGDEQKLTEWIATYGQLKEALQKIATILQEAIDFTPNSPEEQQALLKELRARKKELQVEKRAVAQKMKAIRTEARQKSSDAGFVFGLYYNSKTASSERRGIRYQKEAALQPHETEKDAIERQLIQADRDILWAEKFT